MLTKQSFWYKVLFWDFPSVVRTLSSLTGLIWVLMVCILSVFVFISSRLKAKGMESRRSLSTWLMLQRRWTGLQHVSNTMSNIILIILCLVPTTWLVLNQALLNSPFVPGDQPKTRNDFEINRCPQTDPPFTNDPPACLSYRILKQKSSPVYEVNHVRI